MTDTAMDKLAANCLATCQRYNIANDNGMEHGPYALAGSPVEEEVDPLPNEGFLKGLRGVYKRLLQLLRGKSCADYYQETTV